MVLLHGMSVVVSELYSSWSSAGVRMTKMASLVHPDSSVGRMKSWELADDLSLQQGGWPPHMVAQGSRGANAKAIRPPRGKVYGH